MKQLIHHLTFALGILCLGCTSREGEIPDIPPPVSASLPVEVPFGVPHPPAPSQETLGTSHSNSIATASKAETDAERRTELADHTEKIYLSWNAALTTYRQSLNRWPADLEELRQHQPSLANIKIPDGFHLHLDRAAGEIYLTRTVPSRSAPTPPPPGILMAPLAIP